MNGLNNFFRKFFYEEMKWYHAILILFIALCFSNNPSINPIYWLYDVVTHAQRFHGVVCNDDCSGHKKGFAWAEASEVEEFDQCESSSKSFTEGCEIYLKELAGPTF
jgi:hypothetical protein